MEIDDCLDREIYSPNIEDFGSDSDDIFFNSPLTESIDQINVEILQIFNKRSKYRPMNKVPKAGGLLEKLREMKDQRIYLEGSLNVQKNRRAKGQDGIQRKVEIIDYTQFRQRLLICFKFIDDLDDEENHFLILTEKYKQILSKHSYYSVVFDLPAREISNHHLMHFAKALIAVKKY
jgi:hypothetical protein